MDWPEHENGGKVQISVRNRLHSASSMVSADFLNLSKDFFRTPDRFENPLLMVVVGFSSMALPITAAPRIEMTAIDRKHRIYDRNIVESIY